MPLNMMAHFQTVLSNLEFVQGKSFSEQEQSILNILAYGISQSTPQGATEAASQIDNLCPPLDVSEAAMDYVWHVWDMMIGISMSPGVTKEMHISLVNILQMLFTQAKGEVKVYGVPKRLWRDLPMLTESIDDYLNSYGLIPAKHTTKSVQMLRDTTSFAARCVGAGLAGPYKHIMLNLRKGLEEELIPVEGDPMMDLELEIDMPELRVQIACIWLIHGANRLFWWARENIGYDDVPVEDEAAYIEGGALYQGPSTMCLQRWAFWLVRLDDFGREDSGASQETRQLVLEAAQNMRAIENRATFTT